jgi:hypothetical protein
VPAVVLEPIPVRLPHAVPAAVALLEVPLIAAAVRPPVLPKALWHSVGVLAHVVVAVPVVLLPLPVLQSVLERPREEVPSDLLVDPPPVRQSAPPLPLVVLD